MYELIRGMTMLDVLIKSSGFVFIIILGFILKKVGFFKKEDGLFFSKVVMNITLPAALIANSSGMEINMITISIILIGLCCGFFNIFLAKYVNRRQSPTTRALSMINCSGYNIGNFAIPFAASFFDATGMIYMCMFDIGNAFMGLGGTYALARNEVDGRGRLDIKNLCLVLVKSIPFDVYLLLFILSLFNLTIPAPVTTIASMIGGANSFLAMLMIGIILEIKISRSQAKAVVKILGVRYVGNILLSIVVFFILPLPLLAKQMVTLILFCPISTVSAVYSKMIDNDDPAPALANSISILVSIATMTALLLIFVG